MTPRPRFQSVLALAALLSACGLTPRRVALDDPTIQPLLAAVAEVDRAALGFTPLPTSGDVRLEGASRNYDAMLHLYGETSRTIAFRRVGPNGFKWIGEQEIHTGIREYQSPDGPYRESITITYETEPVSGVPVNTIDISYRGEDPELLHSKALTLQEVAPVLKRWHARKHGGA